MTSRDRGGDNSSRASQRGNNGNQEARDMHETGQHDDDDLRVTGATGERRRKGEGGMDGDRGVGNNTDGVLGGSKGDESGTTRDLG